MSSNHLWCVGMCIPQANNGVNLFNQVMYPHAVAQVYKQGFSCDRRLCQLLFRVNQDGVGSLVYYLSRVTPSVQSRRARLACCAGTCWRSHPAFLVSWRVVSAVSDPVDGCLRTVSIQGWLDVEGERKRPSVGNDRLGR